MSAESAKKPKPEDMLIRVMRVAEILAKGYPASPQPAVHDGKSIDSRRDERAVRVQKTQP